MLTYVAHFDRKSRDLQATKLFQFVSRKEPYAILVLKILDIRHLHSEPLGQRSFRR